MAVLRNWVESIGNSLPPVSPVRAGLNLCPQTGLYQTGLLGPLGTLRGSRWRWDHCARVLRDRRRFRLPFAAVPGCPNVAGSLALSLSRLGRVAPRSTLGSIHHWRPSHCGAPDPWWVVWVPRPPRGDSAQSLCSDLKPCNARCGAAAPTQMRNRPPCKSSGERACKGARQIPNCRD